MEGYRLAAEARSYITERQDQILNCPWRDIDKYTIDYTKLHDLKVYLVSRYGSIDAATLIFGDVRELYKVASDHLTRRKIENLSQPANRLRSHRELYADLTKKIPDGSPKHVGQSKWHEAILKELRSTIADIEQSLLNNRDELPVDSFENVKVFLKDDSQDQKYITVPAEKKPKTLTQGTSEEICIKPEKEESTYEEKFADKETKSAKTEDTLVRKIDALESERMDEVYGKNKPEEKEENQKEVNPEKLDNKKMEDKRVEKAKYIESEAQGQEKDVAINAAEKLEDVDTRKETYAHENISAIAECPSGRKGLITSQLLYAVLVFQLQKPKEPDKLQ